MIHKIVLGCSVALLGLSAPALAHDGPGDAQIAHIAYTAGEIDIAAAKQALAKSHNAEVRAFAEEMVRDHAAVNDKALALVKKLGVTPEANGTSAALSKGAADKMASLAKLSGARHASSSRAYAGSFCTCLSTIHEPHSAMRRIVSSGDSPLRGDTAGAPTGRLPWLYST